MTPYSRPNTLSDLYTLSQLKLLETLYNPYIAVPLLCAWSREPRQGPTVNRPFALRGHVT